MTKGFWVLGAFAAAGLLCQPVQAMLSKTNSSVKKVYGFGPKVEYVEGEFVIQMRKSNARSAATLQSHLSSLGMQIQEVVNKDLNLYLVKSPDAQKTFTTLNKSRSIFSKAAFTQAVINHLSSQTDVDFVEPNLVYRVLDAAPETTPSDAMFNRLWAMKNIGQADSAGTLGKIGADIKATEAWTLGTGSKNVVVAVIDTGVDYNHPDLKENIWSMPGQPAVHGFNTITNTLNPMDDNNHGTHCSGTIGGMGNNAIGVVGVNWNVSIMGVKFLTAQGSGTLANAVKGIDWATNHGAQIMSNSWGGGGFSQALLDAIQRANDKGILFIAAAGNDGSDNDANPSYPASYVVPNVVSIAASTNLDTMAGFSNFGGHTVHLMAPGQNIVSTIPGNKYDSYSGTSMATPHVSGAAALLWAKEPSLNATEIKARLMSSTDKFKPMRRKLVSGGRLNIYNLLMNITGPGFVSIPESAWSAPIAQSIATAHPYPNSSTQRWEISQPGATFVRVHFKSFATEATYDTLKIMSAAGEVVDTLSGPNRSNFWSTEVEGDKVILEFKSDSSVNDAGFELDGYSWTNFSGTALQSSASAE